MSILSKKKGREPHIQSIWITGASSGIGLALSELYAKSGITLALVARRKELLEQVAERCRKKGAIVYTYALDVTDAAAVKRGSEDFLSQVSQIDLVIANAGIRIEEDLHYKIHDIPERMMQTNYLGVIHTFLPFVDRMKEQKSGRLVVISSIASFCGMPNSGAYSASKAAVNMWVESLRLRLNPYSIHVSTLCVGFVKTAMTQDLSFWMPGLLTAPEAASMIMLAIEKRKRFMTFPWQSKFIWSFFCMLPRNFYDHVILFLKKQQVQHEF